MIYISYLETPFGILEIRATSRYILSVLFVDYVLENVTENELTKRCKLEIDEYFEKKRRTFDLPYQLAGTEFSKKVLQEVEKIPYGEVMTYKEIAKNVGKESAVRAVGNMIGKNNLLILLPCHRVIGSNGKMTGYVAGIKIKEKLLDLEKGK